MKSNVKQSNREAAFTIVELLTVMSIIVILIGLLVPALNQVKRYAYEVKQRAQLKSIDTAIELFNSELDGYPNSDALDPDGEPYCGAMKLCEAMLGQDLLGFHPDSIFSRDGTDNTGRQLYETITQGSRKELKLQLESANVYKMEDIYGADNVSPFLPLNYVLCDVYTCEVRTGEKIGMPILYYKADTSNKWHYYDADDNIVEPEVRDNRGNIYNYYDNQELVALGDPGEPAGGDSQHELSEIERFYKNTRNHKIVRPSRPFREDSFILISAGFDSEYGTADDICNFDWKYRE